MAKDGESLGFLNALFLSPNTVGVRQRSQEKLTMNICRLSDEYRIENCELKDVLNELEIFSPDAYDFFPLDSQNNFLFANELTLFSSTNPRPKHYFISYDNELLDFAIIQKIDLAEDSSGNYQGIDDVYISTNGKNLYLAKQTVQHLQLIENSNQWEFSDDVSYSNIREFVANDRGDFFVNRDGYHLRTLDPDGHKFYQSDYFNGLNINDAWFELLNNDHGFFVGGSGVSQLSTFSIDDSRPAVYKDNFDYFDLDAIQDDLLQVDLSDYFVNVEKLFIDGLKGGLIWEPPFVKGSLVNADMFYSTDINDSRPALTFRIDMFLNENADNSAAYFDVTPINKNDAPVLVGDLSTQYLDAGQQYEGVLSDIVKDPDRENVNFSYENLPSGISGDLSGGISGSISKAGTYTIIVTATDELAASFEFNLVLVVRSSSASSESSSGGGVLSLGMLILYLFALFYSLKVLGRRIDVNNNEP